MPYKDAADRTACKVRIMETHRALGLCLFCSRPRSARSAWSCARHLQLGRDYAKRRYRAFIAQGLCKYGDAPLDPSSTALCAAHLAMNRARTERWRARKRKGA